MTSKKELNDYKNHKLQIKYKDLRAILALLEKHVIGKSTKGHSGINPHADDYGYYTKSEIEAELHAMTIENLANIINDANYLHINSIFDIAIETMVDKIRTAQYNNKATCNTRTIEKSRQWNKEELCKKEATKKISIPFQVEKLILNKMGNNYGMADTILDLTASLINHDDIDDERYGRNDDYLSHDDN